MTKLSVNELRISQLDPDYNGDVFFHGARIAHVFVTNGNPRVNVPYDPSTPIESVNITYLDQSVAGINAVYELGARLHEAGIPFAVCGPDWAARQLDLDDPLMYRIRNSMYAVAS